MRIVAGVFDRERERVAAASGEKADDTGEAAGGGVSKLQDEEVPTRSDADISFSEFFVEHEMKGGGVLLIRDFPDLLGNNGTIIHVLLSCIEEYTPYMSDGGNARCSDCFDIEGVVNWMNTSEADIGGALKKIHVASFGHDYQAGFISIDNENVCPVRPGSLGMILPKYVVNDYLRKIQLAAKGETKNSYTDLSFQVKHISPRETIPATIATCPASLHGLYTLLGCLDSSGSKVKCSVSARIFNDALEPSLSPFVEVRSTFPMYSTVYGNDGCGTNVTNYRPVSLEQGSALFVPSSSGPVSFSANEGGWDEALIARFCFLDASNFNSFKSHLQIESFVDPLSDEMLKLLSHPSFDVSMIRDVPSSVLWSDALPNFQQSAPFNVTSSSDDQPIASGHRLKRDRRKRGTFTEWQIGKSWDHRVIGLTLPVMSAPIALDYGRRNATLSWLCPFIKKDGDATATGYIVSWEGYTSDGTGVRNGNVTFDESSKGSILGLTIEFATDKKARSYGSPLRKLTGIIDGLESKTYYTFKVAMYYGENERDRSQSLYSAASETLLTDPPGLPFPISSPPVIVEPRNWNDVLGNSDLGGKNIFKPTQGSDATMVVIEFRSPYDDGGLKITGYTVMRMHTDPSGHRQDKWVLLAQGIEDLNNERRPGRIVQLGIHNMLPGGSYKFKVAAKNSLGISAWSASSDLGVTISSSESQLRYGRRLNSIKGHGFVPDTGHFLHGYGSNWLSSPVGHDYQGAVVIVDDSAQVVKGKGIGSRHVWSCHWSPRSFLVSAETCRVEWESGRDILNWDCVENRIAVIGRNGQASFASMALAAQGAGAIAVIFVDNSECDDFDQYCILGSSKEEGDFWGEMDVPSAWENLLIPVVFTLAGNL